MDNSEVDLDEYLAGLTDPAVPLKTADLTQLSALGVEAVAAAAEAWPRIDGERRRRIISHLSQLAEDNIELDFDALFLIALDDSDATVRQGAIAGLWENESPTLVSRLITIVTDDADAAVRAEAASALGRFALASSLGRLPDRQRDRVEAALHQVIDSRVEVTEVQARALESISPLEFPWVQDAIVAAHRDANPRLKIAAVHAMGRSCEPRWLPTLYDELTNEDPEMRYEAATALGVLGDEDAVPQLLRLVLDEDEEVKEAAMAALGEIGGPKAKEALTILLDSEFEATREAASAALAAIDFEEDPLAVKFRE